MGNVEIGNFGYYNRYFEFLNKNTERFMESYVFLYELNWDSCHGS